MFKKVSLFTLITVTVLLTFQLAFAFPVMCDDAWNACEISCLGTFYLPSCAPSAACDWLDKCTFYCFLQSPPDCFWTHGECCY